MDLRLPRTPPHYRSGSQIARVLTEGWGKQQLYCPACQRNELRQHAANTAVTDYACDGCGQEFQLKSKGGPFGPKVANSAYEKKMDAIHGGRLPNYFFLSYSKPIRAVTDLFVVPGFFIVPEFVERRKALSEAAQRHGWVGSNILLGRIPHEAKIPVVAASVPLGRPTVRANWDSVRFMQERPLVERRWSAEILNEIANIGHMEFHLDSLYAREAAFARTHPENHHIRPKIRQQVQKLRDEGLLQSIGKGRYRRTTAVGALPNARSMDL